MNCLNNNNLYKLYASCCDDYICCHVCHNKNNNHKLNRRKDISHVYCKNCNYKNNKLEKNCYNCGIEFSKKFCEKCLIYNDYYENMHHCDKCNICYFEDPKEIVHCDSCNLCFKRKNFKNHKCKIIKNSSNCQICLEKVLSINDKTIILPCSHLIHKQCFDQLKKHNSGKILRCTICNMSAYNSNIYEEIYDKKVIENPVNISRVDWKTEYLCFDCHGKDITKYHHHYHKCISCKSYNTTSLNTIKV